MQIEQITHGQFGKAYRCRLGEMELIVITDVGPRVLSLRAGDGPNVLFEDTGDQFKRGDWHIYGGHRLWTAPESELSYEPDNVPCQVTQSGDWLKIEAPATASGMQRSLHIGPCETSGGFRLRHFVRNAGPMQNFGSIWCLTCVVPAGRIVAPWGVGAAPWRSSMVRYWNAWAGSTTRVENPQYKQRDGYFMIEPNGETGKAAISSDVGYLALLRPECTFIKTYDFCPAAQYADGCNIALYTNKAFCEMETLGPLRVFNEGETLEHSESWVITKQTFQPENWQQIGALVKK